MITESFGQIIDRMCIENLKAFMLPDPVKKKQCREQAEQLRIAADECVFEIATGKRIPYMNHSNRGHDHKDHDDGVDMPVTIGQTVVALSFQHYTYWNLQTKINAIKDKMDDPSWTGAHDHHQEEFIKTQREIDMCNQNRNDLRDNLDRLFVIVMVHDKHYAETAQHV